MTSVTGSTTAAGSFAYAGTSSTAQDALAAASTSSTGATSSSSSTGSVGCGGGGSAASSSGSSSEIESETTTTNADGSKTVVIKYTDGTETTKHIPADPAAKAQLQAMQGASKGDVASGSAAEDNQPSAVTSFNATV